MLFASRSIRAESHEHLGKTLGVRHQSDCGAPSWPYGDEAQDSGFARIRTRPGVHSA
jgi:hypothetical protein